jgi:hypothetical protein
MTCAHHYHLMGAAHASVLWENAKLTPHLHERVYVPHNVCVISRLHRNRYLSKGAIWGLAFTTRDSESVENGGVVMDAEADHGPENTSRRRYGRHRTPFIPLKH